VLAAGVPIWAPDDGSDLRAALRSEMVYRLGAGELDGWKGNMWIARARLDSAMGAYGAETPDAQGHARPARRVVAYDVSDFIAQEPLPRFYPTRHPWEQGLPMPPEEARKQVREWVVSEVMRPVVAFIAPDSWVENGGDSNDSLGVGNSLVVLADDAVHSRIADLLSMLRRVSPTEREQIESAHDRDLEVARRAVEWLGDWEGRDPGSVDLAGLGEALGVPVLPERSCAAASAGPGDWTWTCEDGGVRMLPVECLGTSAFVVIYDTESIPTRGGPVPFDSTAANRRPSKAADPGGTVDERRRL
jgi:hypothetical protein